MKLQTLFWRWWHKRHPESSKYTKVEAPAIAIELHPYPQTPPPIGKFEQRRIRCAHAEFGGRILSILIFYTLGAKLHIFFESTKRELSQVLAGGCIASLCSLTVGVYYQYIYFFHFFGCKGTPSVKPCKFRIYKYRYIYSYLASSDFFVSLYPENNS